MEVRRIYVTKKRGFDTEAALLLQDLKTNLNLDNLTGVKIIKRYDVQGIDDRAYEKARKTIFSEPNADDVFDETLPPFTGTLFGVELLPGQFDQWADSAAQCISLLTQQKAPMVRCAKLYLLEGDLSQENIAAIKSYLINPVEAREASLLKPQTLENHYDTPSSVAVVKGFINYSDQELFKYHQETGFAMTVADLAFVQDYFKNTEKRDPYITELKVIDTYWSDHCRHTTFLTKLEEIEIEDGPFNAPIKRAYKLYLDLREKTYAGKTPKDITLMDMATIAAKELKRQGLLQDLDESEEVNACSIVVDAQISREGGTTTEKWLISFKNETHNHPTEIEPFGGAATCLGGAIRDPLSGRTYVYQAMRVTGSGDPRTAIKDTLPNKLPQRTITRTAAHGYSSYGNQVGLATGQVSEIYDEGYVAKRLEIGAVVGAAPLDNVVRANPAKGDIIILLGGATGRDGCGGAVGSSKAHTEESLHTCGAEVQKGNPPTERNIQRLFRDPEVTRLIKRCNDFGAGGVCVAIGELAPALDINLDLVPKKYEGLDGTELAISESQERMAVVVDAKDVQTFIEKARRQNLNAVAVATVTDTGRLRMNWKGTTIVDVARAFLNTNGVTQRAQAVIPKLDENENFFNRVPEEVAPYIDTDFNTALIINLQDLNVCSQKGLIERFDASIGKASVLMPLGGAYQLTPATAMAATLPVLNGKTQTATVMSWGYNVKLAKFSPFHGAYYAVVESLCKLACAGGDITKARLTFQEYFERLRNDPLRWGKPLAALLGALQAQMDFAAPAIGGKDSMSGSYMDMDVPPTLVSFALTYGNAKDIISPEFKKPGNRIGYVKIKRNNDLLPEVEEVKGLYATLHKLIKQGLILSAQPVGFGGVAAALAKMCFGNHLGANVSGLSNADYFTCDLGSFLIEAADPSALSELNAITLGNVTDIYALQINGNTLDLNLAEKAYTGVLEEIFPTKATPADNTVYNISYTNNSKGKGSVKIAKPKVVIPVFPGTNCEYDTAQAFIDAGAEAEIVLIRNLTPQDISESITQLCKSLSTANILMIPGGFSGGDEPDGSGKFIATVLRNPYVKDAVHHLLKNKDGLILGICNGFQALIKTGLVPYGEIRDMDETCPTLTYNTIGRHASCISRIRVASNLSPWLYGCEVGSVYSAPVSHGEGRFVANPEMLHSLIQGGQIATQYADLSGNASMDIAYNPNGSSLAIEAITSPDGRVLGKMAHTERTGEYNFKNVPGNYDMPLFKSGVEYFK